MMVVVKTILTRCLFACALLLAGLARAEVINVYTSANFAPLMLADGRGVYPDLIAHLNKHSGSLQYKLHYLPRKRLQVKLEDGSLAGIVIGMMPEWLNDRDQSKYKWTAPFATDRFALVSLTSNPIDPNRIAVLTGGSIGVTTGYVYPGLERWFSQSRLQRLDGASDEKNIEKLLLGRVDCVIVAESMARYYVRHHHLGARLRIFAMAGQQTERRFLVQQRDARLFEPLNAQVRQLRDDAAWHKIAATYE